MNYSETLTWMFNQLPMYQTQGASAYKEDLKNILLLSEHLGNPHKNLACIHVAGTNGKGSTSHMLASVLQAAGYKVGLYTSPHLRDYRERIKINGKEISQDFVCSFIQKHKNFLEKLDISFFEMSVGLAFEYFTLEKVDIAIIEVGMGGRLDATNIITPLVSVITNISMDHTQFLGTTIEAIAKEKGGIIKKEIPVIISEYNPITKMVFSAIAKEKNAEIYFAYESVPKNYTTDLLGDYQELNKKAVIKTIEILQKTRKYKVSETALKTGLQQVVSTTGLKGRWQQIGKNPKIICDTAHNQSGLEIVLQQIKKETYDHLHMVLGFVNDKKINEILPLFPTDASYYFCKPNSPRGLDTEILHKAAIKIGLKGLPYSNVEAALEAAKKAAKKTDFIYVGGSNFVVAEIEI